MTEAQLRERWIQRLQALGAFWEYSGGSFVAEMTLSDQVTDFYFNSDVIHSYPSLSEQLCEEFFLPEIARRGLTPKVVLTVTPFGIPIATVLSLQLSSRLGYLTSKNNLSYYPPKGEESIIVTDDVWSGSSVRRIVNALRKRGVADPRLIIAIGNCSGQGEIEGIATYSLFERRVEPCAFKDSPFAAMQGVYALNAREHWERFCEEFPRNGELLS